MKFPILTFSISAVVIALYAIFGNTPQELIWLAGETTQRPWSFVTAHLVHISAAHLVWNVAAFFILAAIIEQTSKREVMIALGAGMMAVNLYLLQWFNLGAYAGLSGVLNTLLVVALYNLSKQEDYRTAAIITLVASMAKIILELFSSYSLFSSLPWPAVPQAHLAGWVAGVVIVVLLNLVQNRHHKKVLNSYTSIHST